MHHIASHTTRQVRILSVAASNDQDGGQINNVRRSLLYRFRLSAAYAAINAWQANLTDLT